MINTLRKSAKIAMAILAVHGYSHGSDRTNKPEALPARFQHISCAVVQVIYKNGMGTGFFVNPDGDVLTASHVALTRVFSEPQPNVIRLDIDYKPGLQIIRRGSKSPEPISLPKLRDDDAQRATADLAILRTGLKTSCYLPIYIHPVDADIGQHVIAIGYPISAPTGALYEGFVSARYQHLQIPIAVVNNKPIYPTYEVLRIQMPITPGASGSPVIADDGHVIGVISENPMIWFHDLNALIEIEQQNGGFSAPVSTLPKLVAKLAWVVQQFATSGAGLAVPVSYLQVAGQKEARPESPKALSPEQTKRPGWILRVLGHLKSK